MASSQDCAGRSCSIAAGQVLAGISRTAGEDLLVFGYLVAQLPVEGPGVAAGGQGGIGLAGQSLGDHFGRVALVGQDPSVVDGDEWFGVPGVGGLAGAGLAGVAPVGVQGGAAQQVAGLPGAALGSVDGPGPRMRHVRGAVLAGPLHEAGRQHRLLAAAVDTDGEPGLVDAGDGGGGAVDQAAARRAAAGVQQHPVAGLVVTLGGPSRPGHERPADHGSVGQAGPDPIGEVLGVGVRHHQRRHRLAAVGVDVVADRRRP